MRKINGRVLLYETGVPISNLIVAAYDIDPSGEPGRVRFRATDRLGSAVTNANGEFSIEFTEEDFYDRSDREGRPDIVIAIFPPEIAGADQPQESEPLYISSQTRIDAGREEGFAVFLPTQLLRERGIPLFPRPDTPETEDVQESLRRTIEERARAVSLVREALRPEMERRLTVRKSAKQQVARLMGGMPRPGTIADRFVPVGADAAPILKSARNAGIERLAAIKPRGMRLRLTPEMVEAFDLEIDDDGNLAGSQAITNAQFEEFFGHHLATPVLVIDPLLACRVEKQVKNFTDEAEPNTEHSPSTAADVSSPPDESDSLSSIVHDEILKQVQDTILAMTLDNDTGIGVRPNAGMIEKDLAVELTGGPADGPALHDFHNLQIAWDDVWTGVVNGSLVGKMAELYQEIVEVMDWGEAQPDLSEISEIEEFLNMLEEALEVSNTIIGIEPDSSALNTVQMEELNTLLDALSQFVETGMKIT
ncbi:MAG: hypothetical protein GY803_15945, partial [Chloroflexi bacterium]|nr:hypothetical protein [Chloroflexota bacterium]